MAYQSLNIIGSFTAGTSYVQNQVNADRERIEAYRSLLKDQVSQKRGKDAESEALIDDVDADDRMTIGDAPEEQRTPYFLRKYASSPTPKSPETEDASPPPDTEAGPGSRLDTIV